MMIANADQGTLLKSTEKVNTFEPIKDDGPRLPLLECPWRENLAQFVSTRDLTIVAGTSVAARNHLTTESEYDDDCDSCRRLLAPLVELKLETAEAELERVSLPHTRTLRIWSRLAVDAASEEVSRGGVDSVRSLEKLVIRGC